MKKMSYTPINEFKMSRANREKLKKYQRISLYSVDKIVAPTEFYDDLLKSIAPSSRHEFVDGIPFMGKIIVRQK